jgi:hypothetical protein
MIANFEKRVSHKLHGLLRMRAHPFAARKKSGLDLIGPQVIHDPGIIAAGIIFNFTKIEGQGNEFDIFGQFNGAYRISHLRRQGWGDFAGPKPWWWNISQTGWSERRNKTKVKSKKEKVK